MLGVSINQPIKTVFHLLQTKGGLKLLEDPELGTATQEILTDKTKSRHTIQLEISRKEKAANSIVRKYASLLREEDVRVCLYSISDNNSFLNSNRKPITDCMLLLKQYFDPRKSLDAQYSLSIDTGAQGARLSHSHEQQYNYVMQSLSLWATIVEDTFRLWWVFFTYLFLKISNFVITINPLLHFPISSPFLAAYMR